MTTRADLRLAQAKLNAAKSRLRKIADEMQSLLASGETLSAPQEARYRALDAESDTLQDEIKTLSEPLAGTRVTTPQPIGKPMTHRTTTTTADSDYAKLHNLDRLDDGGFRSLGEFFSVLGSGRYDDRVQIQTAAASKLAASGGVLVPEKFVAEALHPPVESELVLPRARQYSMEGFGTLHVSTLDNLTNASGVQYGNFAAQWVAEGGTFTDTTPVTSAITLTRKKLGLFTIASTELVSDSDYEAHLIPALQSAIGDFRDDAFFNGDGSGKPRGILNDAAMLTVSKESGQAAATILIENLDNMYSRIHPRLIRNCRWYCNPTCIPALLKLVRYTGTSGAVVPVLNENSGSFSMYGLPVDLTSKLPVLGTVGDIVLADVSQYAVGMGRGVVVERSDHYKFQTGQVCWRAEWRGDGQGTWRTAFTPRNGSTLSWCVKLATRA